MPVNINSGNLFWQAGIDTKGFDKSATGMLSQFSALGSGGSKLGKILSPKNLGLVGLVVGLEQAGEAAFNFSKEMQSAFAQVQTLSANFVEQSEEALKGIENITNVVPVDTVNTIQGLYQVVSAGFSDVADAMIVLEAASKGAVAGVTDVNTAVDGVTTILNAFNLQATDADEVMSAFFTTVRLGKTTFGEIGSSISNVASIAANFNIKFKDVLAGVATLTKSGVPTAQAVTQIRSAILATSEVAGDMVFQGRSMQEAFALIRESAGGSNTELREMLGRVEALNGVLGLTGDKATVAAGDLNELQTSVGELEKAFGIMVDTTESKMILFFNKLKNRFLKPAGEDIRDFVDKLAEAMNDLLTTSEERVAETRKSILGDFLTDLSKLETAEEKRAAIVQKVNELEMTRSKNREKFQELQEKEPGILRESVEWLNKVLDVTTKVVTGGQVKLAPQLTAGLEINKQIDDLVLYDEALKDTRERLLEFLETVADSEKKETAPALVVDKRKSIKALQDTIKELKTQFEETKDPQKRIELAVQIQLKEEDIEQMKQDVETALLKAQMDAINALPPITLKFKAGLENIKKEVAKLQKEAIKGRLPERLEERIIPQMEFPPETSELIFEAAEAMGELAILAGTFDDELGRVLSKVTQIGVGAANILKGLKSDNPVQVIAGAVQVLTSIFDQSARKQEEMQERAENFSQLISIQNAKLERQIALLDELAGIDRTKGEAEVLELIDRQIDRLNKLADRTDLVLSKTEQGFLGKRTTTFRQNIKDVEELIQALESVGAQQLIDEGFNIEGFEEIQRLIDEYENLIARRRELLEELTQTSAAEIADIITQGFAEGKNSAEDFAGDFEKLMRNAILESFKTRALLQASQGFFDAFAEAARGGLTSAEIENLRNNFAKLVTTASKEFEQLNEIFSQVTGEDLFSPIQESANVMAGTIGRAITEDTATELVGLWTRVSFDTRQQVELQQDMSGTLIQINANTLRAAVACESLDSKIAANVQDDRDTSVLI
jgi:broad specificity phosphatase PhoE